ncbi:WD40-repeat-containing domain protein [Hygrophoropsis aurantiaca]|uniref:WD40-repeat-containing domain protein n=1 Tax=Hygrophoropsis aurantiaca TaxID=72124 RepID=A0ACB7ZYN7_9AGAM|nr:WD40-repeat-containing domain protein [Hygrophoropsis aurantiaca]
MADTDSYQLDHIIQTPAPISSLSFSASGYIFAGSDDGSLRVYHRTSPKVIKAIRGLNEISSIAHVKINGSELGDIWVASGRQAHCFSLDRDQLILSPSDASSVLEIGADDEDVLNELALNHKNTQLAFSLDSGTVGVVDLSTKKITRMRTSHQSICGSVKFIPDRPSELVSGGYDSALLHFDFQQGSVLSRFDLSSAPPASGVSMSPPFILSMSISPSGIIAAGTADGRVWIGTGGEKSSGGSTGQKKKRRKWEGLKHDEGLAVDVAEGPVVATVFIGPRSFLTCTLLGKVTQHEICGSSEENNLSLTTSWTKTVEHTVKVNALIAVDEWIIIGGFGKDGKGVTECWIKKSIDIRVEIPEKV